MEDMLKMITMTKNKKSIVIDAFFAIFIMQTVTIFAQKTCSHFTAEDGKISYLNSPNYPDNYDSDTTVCWTIEAVYPTHRVRIETIDFQLESDSYCIRDFLEIREGSDSGRLINGRFCSTRGPKLTSPGRKLHLRFLTDQVNTAKGFKLRFTSVNSSEIENADHLSGDQENNSHKNDWTTTPNLYLLITACVVGLLFVIYGVAVIVACQHKTVRPKGKRPMSPSAASSQQELATHIHIDSLSHNEAHRSYGTLEPSAPVHYGNANPSSHIATLPPPSYDSAVKDYQAPYMAYGNDAYGNNL